MSAAAAIFAISAAVLAYEVLLIRLLAIVQWHHFAFMVISIALLGFGASGAFLSLVQTRLAGRFAPAFAINAAAFALTALAAFMIAQQLPFNALALAWDPLQLVWLAAMYALFIVPFFCGANAIALGLLCFGERIARIYAANLVGSGAGALAIVGALFVVTPADALRGVAALGLVAAALGDGRRRGAVAAGLVAAAIAVPVLLPASWTALHISEFKGLRLALAAVGARVVSETSSPLGLVTVVDSPQVPVRHAPGLSLLAPAGPPPQLALFTDADAMSAIDAGSGMALAYQDYTSDAVAYHLAPRAEVLVLGAGGGTAVRQALEHGARAVDAVELNPQIARLVRDTHGAFAGNLYGRGEVRLHIGEARGFLTASARRWDLIQLPLVDGFATAASGMRGLAENYLYTVEAVGLYLARLKPGGVLAITRWLKLPPRDALKLFATAVAALERAGVAEPGRRLLLVRSWNTTTLVIRNGAFAAPELAAARAFVAARAFDLGYAPGMAAAEANRANQLDTPYFYTGARELLGPGRADFITRYKFDIRPARDERPYFFDFFRWRALPELLARRAQGGAALIEWGYPILVATFVQAVVLSGLLVIAPLALARRGAVGHPNRWRIAGYFAAIGLAFLFIEIAFIQKFILFLHHPLFAVAVVVASFLVFAGAGSALAPALAARLGTHAATAGHPGALALAVAAIVFVAAGYLALLPALFGALAELGDTARVAVSAVLIAPLGIAMGMPFPLALAQVAARAPRLVAWAWGVNGCASVLGAIAATLVAVQFGFTTVVAAALALYALAALLLRRPLIAAP